MASSKYSEVLKKFLSGELSMGELSNIIDDRLFELRQTPDLTDEEDLLAGIELIIHEIKDGFRTKADLEEHIKFLINPRPVVIFWGDTPSAFESKSSDSVSSGAVSKEVKTTLVIPDPVPDPVVDYRFVAQFV